MKKFLWTVGIFLISRLAAAGGPILIDNESTGKAVVWQNGVVHYNPETGDQGTLGRLTNQQARDLVKQFFQDWASVTINGIPAVSLTIEEGTGLGNVDTTNFNTIFTYCPPKQTCPNEEDSPFVKGTARKGESPVVFDNDGQLTDMVFGSGSHKSVLGFAGPRVVERGEDGLMVITESEAVLNGLFVDCPDNATAKDPCQSPEVTEQEFAGAIFHEMGHFLGLDHTQVNLSSALRDLNGDKSESDAIPTMLPLFVDGIAQRTPHFDDIVALASLYPSNAFKDSFCTITGKVFQSDGVTEFQGVNVIVRNPAHSLTESTSSVSGLFYTGKHTGCSATTGTFTLGGISPGTSYTLEIEPISSSFTGGSSIEPCDPPAKGFDAAKVAGTFSCATGGSTITAGSATNTNVVTTKQATTSTTGDSDNASAAGCSLIP